MVSERTTRSAPTTCATVLSNEALMPFANTATKTTSPSPTMSAAAVVAVRPGLRIAFSRASRPGSANRRSSGQPTAPASGRTNQRALRATPTNSSTTPPAIIESLLAAGPPANKPGDQHRDAEHGDDRRDPGCPAAPRALLDVPLKRRDRRDARRASRGCERGYLRNADPDAERQRDRPSASAPRQRWGARGRSASNIDARAFANASPSKRPSTDAADADHERLGATARRI